MPGCCRPARPLICWAGCGCCCRRPVQVPEHLVWDNESGIGQGRQTEPAAAFAGVLGCEIRQLPPWNPESKGIVERMNAYFRQRFVPGRTFASRLDLNDQLADWLPRTNGPTPGPGTAARPRACEPSRVDAAVFCERDSDYARSSESMQNRWALGLCRPRSMPVRRPVRAVTTSGESSGFGLRCGT
ncbi:hypothetical protein J2S90_004885 [Arthrobacter bambusae]|uniref:Integrase catalytic domain-containing protein n=1 Tax=Arthrobacter bambusae TaxID=1338426 RepID=A0AAW8DNC5_9MICC|nr:hypothetical protein [Arthrobacter bambusae]MDQ0132081.1 hypothetical protein [Arthrobacter bambusae]MDQ0183422.1 hypothetical protein [Arthrobacter bambusae]